MARLDVEQQLREQRAQQLPGSVAATHRAPPQLFMSWKNLGLVAQPSAVVLASAVATAALLLFLTASSAARQARLAAGLRRSGTAVVSAHCTAPVYAAAMALWLLAAAANTVARMMAGVAAAGSEAAPSTLATLAQSPSVLLPFALFPLQLLGLAGLWAYPLTTSKYVMEMGVAASLLVFFPSFYQSLALDNDDPERLPFWSTHLTFFASLFATFVTTTPWLQREFNTTLRDIETHTHQALYRDRPELRDLQRRRRRELAAVKEELGPRQHTYYLHK